MAAAVTDTGRCLVDGLYGTGLRLQEWASVLINELRHPAAESNYVTLRLADACAKGGHGHPYWAKRDVLNSVWNYIETERAASIRRAQASGVYERLSGLRIICEVREEALVTLNEPGSPSSLLALNDLSPEQRRSLFMRTAEGLEPLVLWLNEDGLPRGKRSWYKSFNGANRRVAGAGIDRLECHPHVLRIASPCAGTQLDGWSGNDGRQASSLAKLSISESSSVTPGLWSK